MKRLLSLLVVIAMVVSMIPNVFAAKEEIDMDELLGRLVVLEDISLIEVKLAEGSDGMIYQWTPAADEEATELNLSWYPETAVLNVTATTGETTVSATTENNFGEVTLPIVPGQLVEIEVSEATGAAAEAYIGGALSGYPAGHESSPIPVSGPAAEVTIEKASWFQLYFVGDVVITGEGAFNVVYEAETIAAVDGKVTIAANSSRWTPATTFQIDTAGTYTVTFIIPVGSMENPAALVIGDNAAEIKAGAQGYFYTWTATEEGTLVITMKDANWTYTINNMTSYAYGDTQWSDSDPVVNPAEIEVKAGDEIQIVVNTYDPAAWEAPAGTVNFTAEFKAPAPAVPEFISHPADASVKMLESAQFSVEFNMTEGVKYQWQYSADGGATWKNTTMTGYNTATLTAAMSVKGRNGYMYRCQVTFNGVKYNSNPATFLLVQGAANVTTQPTDTSVVSGDLGIFTLVDDTNGAATYQWQYQKPGSTNWANTKLPGYNTATLKVPTYDFRDGYKYRCRIETPNGKGTATRTYSDTVTLHVSPVAVVTVQPTSTQVVIGNNAVFHVEAEGQGLTYQWQYCKDGKTWINTTAAGTGFDTNTLTVAINDLSKHGWKYRCEIKNEFAEYKYDVGTGKAYSEIVTLNVIPVVIEAQPESVTAAAGSVVNFTVKVSSPVEVTYQWQYSKDGGKTWSNTSMTGAKTDTLVVDALTGRNGYMYRCNISVAATGYKGNTAAATLTVE